MGVATAPGSQPTPPDTKHDIPIDLGQPQPDKTESPDEPKGIEALAADEEASKLFSGLLVASLRLSSPPYSHRRDRYPLAVTQEYAEPPETYEMNVAPDQIIEILGIKPELLERIEEFLHKARSLGDDDPTILNYGSAARTVRKAVDPNFLTNPHYSEFDPDRSDLDLFVPEVLTAAFGIRESTMTQPDPRYSVSLLRWVKILQGVSDPHRDRFELFTHLTAKGSEVHPLHLIHLIVPDRHFIRFTLNDTGGLEATSIEIVQDSPQLLDRYDPEHAGIRAYGMAIYNLATETEEQQILRIADRMTQLHPEKLLEESLATWTDSAVDLHQQGINDVEVPKTLLKGLPEFDETSRGLAMKALRIMISAERSYEALVEKTPEETIWLLGRSGLLSLILQSGLVLGNHMMDTVGKYCRLYISAMERTQDPSNPYHALFKGARENPGLKEFLKYVEDIGEIPETGRHYVIEDTGDPELPWHSFEESHYKAYAQLALAIAQMDPRNFAALRIHEPAVDLSKTWLALGIEASTSASSPSQLKLNPPAVL